LSRRISSIGGSATSEDQGAIVASDAERLSQYCPDLHDWPRSWSVEPCDIEPGQRLVVCFTPFLLHLLDLGLSRKTLRMHRDNLWLLGGELIRALYDDPPLRNRPVEQTLSGAIEDDRGPLIYHGTEEQQRSFDSTCRRFHRSLQLSQSPPA
jgi:hypothetical protein